MALVLNTEDENAFGARPGLKVVNLIISKCFLTVLTSSTSLLDFKLEPATRYLELCHDIAAALC